MSVFGLIKRGRQAAKEHKAGLAEKQKAEEQKPAYRHIPTHAAVDALSGAPSSWRNEDRSRILEQNRRRSAMAASGLSSMGPPVGTNPVHMGMPRINSALSHVSYPSLHANPVVALPRTYSYHGGIHPAWAERSSEVVYPQPDPLHGGQHQAGPTAPAVVGKGKGKGVDRPAAASRSSSKAPSPVGSSADSTSSQDDLEMKTSRRHRPTGSNASQSSDEARVAHVHRLHPSQQQRSRRPSDPPPASMDRHPPAVTATERYPPPAMERYFQSRTAAYRPSPSRTGSLPIVPTADPSDIPPVPLLPPMSFGPSLTTSTPSSSSSATPSSAAPSIRSSKAVATGSVHSSSSPPARPESPMSPVTPISLASPVSPAAAASSARPSSGPGAGQPEPRFDFNLDNPGPGPSLPSPKVPPEAAITPAPAPRVFHLRQSSRTSQQPPRVFDFEPMTFSSEPFRPMSMPTTAPPSSRSMPRASVVTSQLPIEFDEGALNSIQESAATHPPAEAQKGGKGRLVKAPQGAKLAKKNRWSLRSKPTPVAG